MLGFSPISSAALSDLRDNKLQPVTGVSATSGVGSVTAVGVANIPETGLAATGQVGPVAVNGAVIFVPTGQEATGSVGSVTVAGLANVLPTSPALAASIGTVSVGIFVTAPVTGIGRAAEVGSIPQVTGLANVVPTGVEDVGQVGSVSTIAEANLTLQGVVGTTTIDDGAEALAAATAIPGTPVAFVGSVGQVRMYSQIPFPVPNLDPWTPLADDLADQSFNTQVTPDAPFADVWQLVDLTDDTDYTQTYTDEVIGDDVVAGTFEEITEVA